MVQTATSIALLGFTLALAPLSAYLGLVGRMESARCKSDPAADALSVCAFLRILWVTSIGFVHGHATRLSNSSSVTS